MPFWHGTGAAVTMSRITACPPALDPVVISGALAVLLHSVTIATPGATASCAETIVLLLLANCHIYLNRLCIIAGVKHERPAADAAAAAAICASVERRLQ